MTTISKPSTPHQERERPRSLRRRPPILVFLVAFAAILNPPAPEVLTIPEAEAAEMPIETADLDAIIKADLAKCGVNADHLYATL